MRAVNLLPADLRGGRAGGSGGKGVYFLLGALALVLVLVSAYTVAGRSVVNKKNELTQVTADADSAVARAGQLEPYARFAELRTKRVETVSSLARSRFNWPYALREVSRVMPGNVWLTQLVGTVAPGVTVSDASSGATSGLRSALAVPAIEIKGCSTHQDDVARYLARLRLIEGVTRVSIASSEKNETGSTTGGSDGGDCRQGTITAPMFELVVFFEGSTATPSQATGSTPAAPPNGRDTSK